MGRLIRHFTVVGVLSCCFIFKGAGDYLQRPFLRLTFTSRAFLVNMKLSKAQEKLEIAEIEARLERLTSAAKEYEDAVSNLLNTGGKECTDDDLSNLEHEFKHKYEIPHGVVFLGSEQAWIDGDTKLFMRFATWWIQGAMTNELFNLFVMHYEEVIEIDYTWILMDRPSFYYFDETTREDYESRIEMLRAVGIRDEKRNKCINFKLRFSHGDYIRGSSN